MSDLKNLVVIRHASAEHEKTEMGGWTDTGLEAEGEAEAIKAGEEIPKDVKGIVTSDLERAVETAKIISKETGIPILEQSSSLRSWNMGKFAGKDPKKIEPILDDLAEHHPNESTDDGESFNHYKNRFLKGVEAIIKKYKGKKIAILTHSHGTRILRGWEAKGCPSDLSIDMKEYNRKPMPNGGVDEVQGKKLSRLTSETKES